MVLLEHVLNVHMVILILYSSHSTLKTKTPKKYLEKALEITIELAKEAGELASKFLNHMIWNKKTFMPFCLLSKKDVGMLYEEDPNVCYQKSMGIVLRR